MAAPSEQENTGIDAAEQGFPAAEQSTFAAEQGNPAAASADPATPAELVVLLDEAGRRAGTADKREVHTDATPLHLAFSCYLFNDAGEVLVTRRALSKVAWPGVWTNAVCGHPMPDEAWPDAVGRRASHELGIDASVLDAVVPVLPDFRYWARDASGIVENEVCPVFRIDVGAELAIAPNPAEVTEFRWVAAADLAISIGATPWAFSPWLVEQVEQGALTARDASAPLPVHP